MAPRTLTEVLAQIAQRIVERLRDAAAEILFILWIGRDVARCRAYELRAYVRQELAGWRRGFAWAQAFTGWGL